MKTTHLSSLLIKTYHHYTFYPISFDSMSFFIDIINKMRFYIPVKKQTYTVPYSYIYNQKLKKW
jgi:hypothetical protein